MFEVMQTFLTNRKFKIIRIDKMEALGIMGFIFGLAALGKVLMMEKELKDKGVLGQDDKEG